MAHRYEMSLAWTGNEGTGTSGYRAYSRSHELSGAGKSAVIAGSSDPAFRGDRTRYNPEELLVSALSACHLLSYLHVCADAGVVVSAYEDHAEGSMVETPGGGGHFTEVVLRPVVTLAPGGDPALADALHEKAHHLCFIASSVSFPVRCEPRAAVEGAEPAGAVPA